MRMYLWLTWLLMVIQILTVSWIHFIFFFIKISVFISWYLMNKSLDDELFKYKTDW